MLIIHNLSIEDPKLFICNIIFSQTNITTPMGSTGFGVWTTIHQAFKENETVGSIILDLHLNIGLEFLVGKSISSNVDYSFNQFGIAYDIKLFEWGSKLYCKRYDGKVFERKESCDSMDEISFGLSSFIFTT